MEEKWERDCDKKGDLLEVFSYSENTNTKSKTQSFHWNNACVAIFGKGLNKPLPEFLHAKDWDKASHSGSRRRLRIEERRDSFTNSISVATPPRERRGALAPESWSFYVQGVATLFFFQPPSPPPSVLGLVED
ncbi:hypothetical protein RND71_017980 [Anisodus tanguticus]|uniref:Uncharacterized protein n=1 Tax=Anisodus tanguticus TaxID=243964 RepID=A0AAE1VIV1_9SOLA|nr:hypothetical protein RND71_017980 [Anisodus tanguticus]